MASNHPEASSLYHNAFSTNFISASASVDEVWLLPFQVVEVVITLEVEVRTAEAGGGGGGVEEWWLPILSSVPQVRS